LIQRATFQPIENRNDAYFIPRESLIRRFTRLHPF
jgi:hypothetical protein